jgi:hypothetical protein
MNGPISEVVATRGQILPLPVMNDARNLQLQVSVRHTMLTAWYCPQSLSLNLDTNEGINLCTEETATGTDRGLNL